MTKEEEERVGALRTYKLMVCMGRKDQSDFIKISTVSDKSQRVTLYLDQQEAASLIDMMSRLLVNVNFAGVTTIRNSAEVEFDPGANMRFFGLS